MRKLIRNIALSVLMASALLLSVTSANAQCTVQIINYGQTVNGSLSTTDCIDIVGGASYYADHYRFTGAAGDKIAIQMSSTSLDTWLTLKSPSGNLTEDDDGGGGTNSRIPATSGYYTLAESGTYQVDASSSYSNTTGSYTLSLAKEAVASTPALNLVNGWNLLGNSSSTALNVASAFGDPSKVTTVWKWNPATAKWAFYTPTQTDGGAAYAASRGYELMTSVAGGEGFWVNAKTPFTAALPTGTAIDSASFKNLATGWTLIATGDNKTPGAFNNALSTTTPAAGQIPNNFTSLWAWDTARAKWYLYVPSLDATGGLAAYIQTNGYLDFTVSNKKLGQGIGFWVNKAEGGTPTPPPSAKATTFDVASVKAAIPGFSAIVPICSKSSQQSAAQASSAIAKSALLPRAMEISQVHRAAFPAPSKKASGPTKPVDTLGECGGRQTYPQYSHVSGVTTATLAFENYCSTDSDGGRQFVNGSIDYVNTGTPTESGPITTKVAATSPAGLSVVQQDKTSKVLSSQLIVFNNFNYTVGVPGGKPTQAQPSSYGIDELTITDKLTNKIYRQSGYKVVYFTTPSGGQQLTMSGRGYRSNGDYFDVSTTTPQVTDSSGNTVSGVIAFTGANGSVAVATFVPGKVSQATMTVNGTPVTGLPACK